MLQKLSAIWNLFRKGQEIANPELWKDVQNAAMVVGGIILGLINLASLFGYELPIPVTPDQANAVGLGIATVVGFVLHNITSKRAGILPAKRESLSDAVFDAADTVQAGADAAADAASRFDRTTADNARKWLDTVNKQS